MNYFWYSGFVWFCLCGLIFPQAIFINADKACFLAPDNRIYIELYLSFAQDQLEFIEEEDGFVAIFSVTTNLFLDDSLVSSNSQVYNSLIPSAEEVSSSRLFVDSYIFQLASGNYYSTIIVEDHQSNGRGEFSIDIQALPFHPNRLSMSDIELCSKIQKQQTEHKFQKGNLSVIPNPSGLFGVSLPVLYYYVEVYNLHYSTEEIGEYRLETIFTDIEGKLIKKCENKILKKSGENAVLVGGYNIMGLPPDTYFFSLTVTDQFDSSVVTAVKRFRVIKPKREQDSLQVPFAEKNALDGVYQQYSDLELDKEFSYAGYIATKEEKKVFESLNSEAKRSFLKNFWNDHKNSEGSSALEYRNDYLQRVGYANQLFRSNRMEGWKTDRGRILLQYGRPDEIRENSMVESTKPSQIWYYHQLEGGVSFVFVDKKGYGDFELVHSTYSRELSNPQWQSLLDSN